MTRLNDIKARQIAATTRPDTPNAEAVAAAEQLIVVDIPWLLARVEEMEKALREYVERGCNGDDIGGLWHWPCEYCGATLTNDDPLESHNQSCLYRRSVTALAALDQKEEL